MATHAVNIVEAHDEATIDAIKHDTSAFDNYIRDLKLKIAAGNVHFFGAHDGKSFVGRICLVLVPEEQAVQDILPGQPALVALQVNKSVRRHGVGTALVTAVTQKAKQLGYEQLSLGVEKENEKARALYEKLGFSYTGHVYQSCWDEPDGTGNLKRVCVEAMLMMKQV